MRKYASIISQIHLLSVDLFKELNQQRGLPSIDVRIFLSGHVQVRVSLYDDISGQIRSSDKSFFLPHLENYDGKALDAYLNTCLRDMVMKLMENPIVHTEEGGVLKYPDNEIERRR